MTVRAAWALGFGASLELAVPAPGRTPRPRRSIPTPRDRIRRAVQQRQRRRRRFMRFEDLRSGALIDRARYTREKETRLVHFEADRVGWRDQRYAAEVDQFGRMKAWVEFRGIPFRYDDRPRTIFTETSPRVAAGRLGPARIQNRTRR